MKNQCKKNLLFYSENIRIIMEDHFVAQEFSKKKLIEGKESFNILFFLSPDINFKTSNCSTTFLFKENQYILHYSKTESHAEVWTNKHQNIKYFQIQINYNFIVNLTDPESNTDSAEIIEKMTKNNFIFLYKETPPHVTVEMQIILKEIVNYSKKGVLQKLFVEAKIIKILILIFEQFNEKEASKQPPNSPSIIKKYIDNNYHKNIKAEELGKIIGLNQNKIRKEFKSQYKQTVTDYISELKMLKAKKLIIDNNMMIKEVAIECGYEYVQNFTRAFKKKFGVSPEKLRKT